MTILPLDKLFNLEDRHMKTVSGAFDKMLIKWHPSYLMSILLVLVYIAIGESQQAQSAPILTWMIQHLPGVTSAIFSAGFWKNGMLLAAIIIAVAKPSTLGAFLLSFPLVIYGFFALIWGISTHEVPYPLLVMTGWGYVCTLVLMTQQTFLGLAARKLITDAPNGNGHAPSA